MEAYMLKTCGKCKQALPFEMFSKDRTKKDGMQYRCKPCQSRDSAAFAARNPGYFKQKGLERYHKIGASQNQERYQRYKSEYLERAKSWRTQPSGRLYSVYAAARSRAKQRGLDFEISLEWVESLWDQQKGRCKVSGIQMTTEQTDGGQRFYHPFNPSLDRIDASLGYTTSNTRLVSVIVNVALNRFGDETFKAMCIGACKTNNWELS